MLGTMETQLISQSCSKPKVCSEICSLFGVLSRASGKCTTDHISPAGPWYNYRGHLENISNNLFLRAENAFLPPDSRGLASNVSTGSIDPVPTVAKAYKASGIRWCIIGHNNYGEGSSREHAALEPRFLGGVAVIANSFARIHETNLKKQGILPLTFADSTACDRIREGDRLDILRVENIQHARPLTLVVRTIGAYISRRPDSVFEVWFCS